MSFVEMNLDDVEEQSAAPEGEYDVRVTNAVIGEAKSSGNPQIVVSLAIEGGDFMPTRLYLGLPAEDDDDDMRKRKMRTIKRFVHHFGIPSDGGFNVEDFFGATARCLVTQDEPNDNGDIYNRVIVPRLKN